MSTTSLQSPQKAPSSTGPSGSTTSEKPSFLRSALPMEDPAQGKATGNHRMWRSGMAVAEEKVVGEEGERVVVQAW